MFTEKAVFRYIFCVLNCHVFGADDYRTCTKIYIYNLSYIILETKINFQNAVTFVLVKLDTKFKVQNWESLNEHMQYDCAFLILRQGSEINIEESPLEWKNAEEPVNLTWQRFLAMMKMRWTVVIRNKQKLFFVVCILRTSYSYYMKHCHEIRWPTTNL